MRLYIDSSSSEIIKISIDNVEYQTEARIRSSQLLLPFIFEKLNEQGVSLSSLKEIDVALGPGSFTGLRVGVSIAQALAWALKIKVNGSYYSESKIQKIKY